MANSYGGSLPEAHGHTVAVDAGRGMPIQYISRQIDLSVSATTDNEPMLVGFKGDIVGAFLSVVEAPTSAVALDVESRATDDKFVNAYSISAVEDIDLVGAGQMNSTVVDPYDVISWGHDGGNSANSDGVAYLQMLIVPAQG